VFASQEPSAEYVEIDNVKFTGAVDMNIKEGKVNLCNAVSYHLSLRVQDAQCAPAVKHFTDDVFAGIVLPYHLSLRVQDAQCAPAVDMNFTDHQDDVFNDIFHISLGVHEAQCAHAVDNFPDNKITTVTAADQHQTARALCFNKTAAYAQLGW